MRNYLVAQGFFEIFFEMLTAWRLCGQPRLFALPASAASQRDYRVKATTLFAQIAQPDSTYLAVSEISSERRKHICLQQLPISPQSDRRTKKKIGEAAQGILDVRAKYPGSSLADLYDPVTIPPDLVRAHQALDKAVDLCYRPQPFPNELGRIEFLFGLYEQYSAPMFGGEGRKGSKGK